MINVDLTQYLERFKAVDGFVKNIQLSRVGDFEMVSAFDDLSSDLICESIYTGMDPDKDLAVRKCISEYVERKVFAENAEAQRKLNLPMRSDGFAAYPMNDLDPEESKTMARQIALAEATERYVWATWWDNIIYGHKIDSYSALNFPQYESSVRMLNTFLNIHRIHIVEPLFGPSEYNLVILFLETKEGGFLTGGACDLKGNRDNAVKRALAELMRHCLAYRKFIADGIQPQSFYERRLLLFASGHGASLVKDRLRKQRREVIELPELIFDEALESKYQELFIVHRCVYKNQPPFIGGELARLCL